MEAYEMTREEYRRTIISDEDLKMIPLYEERANAEQAVIDAEPEPFFWELGAINGSLSILETLKAKKRVAYKRHERAVKTALENGLNVPHRVLKDYQKKSGNDRQMVLI